MRMVVSLISPIVAVIVVSPSSKLWAKPVFAPMVATSVSELVQVTLVVISAVDSSE